jgi:hypothetical protein
MRGQREIDQLRVGDDRGIEVDLEALGLIAQVTIGRIGVVTAGVAYARAPDSLDEPKLGIRSPESTDAKGGGRKRGRNLQVYGRNRQWLRRACRFV